MGSKRAPEVGVLRVVSRFMAVLGVVALLTIVVSLAALAQLPQARQPNAATANSINRAVQPNSSDSSLFLPVVTYLSGGIGPFSVALGDVNGDGKLDMVAAEIWTHTVSVLLGNGDGTFQPAATYDSGGINPICVVIADLNGDGRPDLVVANDAGTVGVLLGNGDGTFSPVVNYATGGSYSISVAVGDVNGDGKPDLVVGNGTSSWGVENVGVLLGNGEGTFQPALPTYIGGYGGGSLAIADVNGDGKPDLLVTNLFAVDALLGNGDGTFRVAGQYSTGISPETLEATRVLSVADVNGDGKLDAVVADGGGAGGDCSGTGHISVLEGNGDGTFQPALVLESGGCWPQQALVADLNGDGKPDLMVANTCDASGCHEGSVGVLLGNGDGTFQPVVTYDSGGWWATAIAIADVNADDKSDVIVANEFSQGGGPGAVGVLLNNSSGPQNPTTTALASSLHSTVYGQVVTFTTKVTSSSGTPTGTVQILNGPTVVGTGTLVNGSVSIPVSTLPAGSDSITASYLGGSGFAPSKSSPLTQTVTPATTATSLASSLNPAATNQSITFTATVTSQYGGAATGAVTFMAGSQNLGSSSLTGNVATFTTAFATAGTYSISAQYTGDSNNTGSISPTLSEKIITSTTTALVSSLNPSVVGQAVTFTATVSSSAGAPPNGETITFKNGSAVLGTAPLSGGMASLTTSSLSAGAFTITASYPGDSTFAASTSPGLRQVVNSTTKSATSTTFVSSLNPSIYGQKVTWTATVTTIGPVPPTGTVSFNWSDGFRTFNIGSATLNSSGVAVLTRSNLNADPYPLTAKYQGDINNLTSTSPILNQTVLQATSAATITSLPNPSSLGQAVTFTAKITSPTVSPTGPVTFSVGNTVLASVQLSGGKATFTTSSLPLGSSVVTVTFNGSSNITKSSASVTQVVQQ